MQTSHPVIFYDGVCGLCNKTVQFIIRHDRKRKFRFATLQSALAKETLGDTLTFDSFVFFHAGKARFRSAGALYMLRELGGFWGLSFACIVIPRFIRDGVYNWVARNRYAWFGKYDSCPIPDPETKGLFLD